jgi:hypothetical protein
MIERPMKNSTPMKMEQTQCSETSTQNSDAGESTKKKEYNFVQQRFMHNIKSAKNQLRN